MTPQEAGVRGTVSKAGEEREPTQLIEICDLRTKALRQFPILPIFFFMEYTQNIWKKQDNLKKL